jgi:Mlc titration factor MtfA (ptsG expression regulator)
MKNRMRRNSLANVIFIGLQNVKTTTKFILNKSLQIHEMTIKENYSIFSEYSNIILFPPTFMVGHTMN